MPFYVIRACATKARPLKKVDFELALSRSDVNGDRTRRKARLMNAPR